MQDRVINDTSNTITNTSMVISQAVYGSTRLALSLQNISTDGSIISIAFGKDATANQGIVLKEGQSYIFSADAGYTPPDAQITAISDTGTGVLSIHEELRI